MSDLDLRTIERDAAREPSVANRWRLVRALERAEKRSEAFPVLCELARAGEREAVESVRLWNPWSARTGAAGRRRSISPGSSATSVASWTVPIAEGASAEAIAATDRVLLLLATADERATLLAVSTEERRVLWHADGVSQASAVAIAGDTVVHEQSNAIVLRDVTSGDVLATRALEPSESIEIWTAGNDRALLVLSSGIQAIALSPSRFGEALWKRENDAAGEIDVLTVTFDRVLLHRRPQAAQLAIDLETGSVVWEKSPLTTPEPGALHHYGFARGLDREAVGFLAWSEPLETARQLDVIFAVDLDRGDLMGVRLPPFVRQEAHRDAWFDADARFLVCGRHGAIAPDVPRWEVTDEVIVVKRDALAPAPLATGGRVVATPGNLGALALAADALHYTSLAGTRRLALHTIALDAFASARPEVFTLTFDIARVSVVPVEGATLVFAAGSTGREVFLARKLA